MSNTSPAPNVAPISGMCPGVAALGAGGGAGGSGAGGGAGGSGNGGGGGGNGNGSNPNQTGAQGEGEPIDPITGRVYTIPAIDLALPGPLPFSFTRVYSSAMAHRDSGLGFGWTSSLGWFVEVLRTRVRVWNEQGISVDFEGLTAAKQEAIGMFGWLLRRTASGFELDVDDGVWRVFSMGAPGGRFLLSEVRDRSGNKTSLRYDGGRLSGATDSAGREIRFAPGPGGRIAAVEAKNALTQGRWVVFARYEHDQAGNLVKVTDPEGYEWAYTYDDQHRLTSHTNRVGLSFHYVYDRQGRAVETWGAYPGPDPALSPDLSRTLADGETRAKGIFHVKIEYGPNGYSEVVDSRKVKRIFGNALGLADKVVDGGAVVESRYDNRGFLIARTDAVGATYRYERDERGRVWKKIDPYGRETVLVRGEDGGVARAIDPSGAVTEFEYDARGLPVLVRTPSGAVTRVVYDERGLVAEVHDPLGGLQRFARDAQGNVVQMTEPGGGVWRSTYDEWGLLTRETAPTGASVQYRYSLRGDVIAKSGPDGATAHYRYDGERHLVEQLDALGRVTRFVWGGYHSICARTNENGHTVRLLYDRECQLVSVLNERGEEHRFERDLMGAVREEGTFDGRRLRCARDAMGRVVRVEGESGVVLEMTLGLEGEILTRTGQDGMVETFEYDARGLVKAVESGGVRIELDRDAVGQVVRETQEVDGKRFAVDVRHDIAGRRVARRTSSGHTVELVWDMLGDVRGIRLDGSVEVSIARDGLGRETTRMLGGGGRIDSAFDIAGRLVRRAASTGARGRAVAPGEPEWVGPLPESITTDAVYRYDPMGDLVESWDMRRGRIRYEHDPAGRLLSAIRERGQSEQFVFDSTNNLFERDPGAGEREYGPGNRLLRRGDVRYVWDDEGRLAEKRRTLDDGAVEVTRYRWNGRGLLESVETPGGAVVSFRYDAFARRVEKRVSRRAGPYGQPVVERVTRYFWDRHVPVHEVTRIIGGSGTGNGSGSPEVVSERTYVFQEGSFEPLAQKDGGGEWLHALTDQIGTPAKLVNGRGEVAGEVRLSAWGQPIDEQGVRTPLRFQGQYADEETGLHYNRFRYYDPEAARYISPDPFGLWGDFNSYVSPTDPTSRFDPVGRLDEFYTPSGAKRPEREAEIRGARQRYADRGLNEMRNQMINRAAKDTPTLMPNTSNCCVVANDVRRRMNLRGQDALVVDIAAEPEGSPLAYYSLSDPHLPGSPHLTEGGWNRHHVNVDPENPGGIVDHDQGLAWDNKQQMVNAMFTSPVKLHSDPRGETVVGCPEDMKPWVKQSEGGNRPG